MNRFDAEIREIASQIARLVRDAYERGENDAIDRMVRAARSGQKDAEQAARPVVRSDREEHQRRKRAPKGAVEALVARALGNGIGKTPDEIKAEAKDDHERMIARSSIRAHLRAGVEAGRYVKQGGRWYLASTPPWERDEATAPPMEHSATPRLPPDQGEHR
jgi:hypothetical protein